MSTLTTRLSATLLAICAAQPALADNDRDGSDADQQGPGVPQVSACSTRHPLIASPAPALGEESAHDAIRKGFDTTRTWGTEENVELLSGDSAIPALRVHYPEDTSSPGDTDIGGAGFYTEPAALEQRDHVCLSYRVRFERGFDFVKGGKLPGLYGGEAPSGGDSVTGENGFSMRYMWRKDGQGELYEYVVGGNSDYGESVARGRFTFPTGQWVTLEQEIILNDPGKPNGVARVWVDGRPILEQTDLTYRTTDKVHVDGLMFSTFFGGHGGDWRTPSDQHADFTDFRFYAPRS